MVTKPWIRIDGMVNRKVLDRMLGAVLSYCLLHPGLLMTKVQARFTPALQPFHTRELVEVCVNSLFSCFGPGFCKLMNVSRDEISEFCLFYSPSNKNVVGITFT